MSNIKSCPKCGAPLPPDSPPGQCVACLLEVGLSPKPRLQDGGESDAVSPLSAQLTEAAGEQIGHYKLLKKYGEGGCGVVYMAEQREPIRRRVALKIIKPGMDTKQVLGRFEAERQALAMMDHPHIAKVFDAGATESGRPYFVMELIQGIPITRYCDENKLTTRQRLELFIQVCQAVQHAHQKGIIHRDIKPSNILVADHDGVAVPKIIDFGIAKAVTDQTLTGNTGLTVLASFLGTPAYMSPEQAQSALDIDTRSDIYSLGVLLYEMLTGKTPFDPKELVQAGVDEIRRIILQVEPPRPSTRLASLTDEEQTTVANSRDAEAPKLANLLRGDLDWIVMKTLDKDRNRRYETANGLAADVKRHLNHELVVARPPSRLYRFRKMVQRNKVSFLAGSAIATSLLVGFCLTVAMYAEKKHALEDLSVAHVKQTELFRLAEESGQQAKSEAQVSRQNQYAADMLACELAMEQGNLRLARKLLSYYLPSIGREDLRTFEWYYYNKLCLGDQLRALKGHSQSVYAVAWSPDGKKAASASYDGTVRLWNTDGWQCHTVLSNHIGQCTTVAFSPDGSKLATGSEGTGLYLWDLRSNSIIAKIEASDPRATFSPNQPFIAVATGGAFWGGEGGSVGLWDFNGHLVHSMPGAGNRCVFSRDGKLLATANSGGKIRVWSVATYDEVDSFAIQGYVLSLAFSTNSKVLAYGTGEGEIGLRNVVQHSQNMLRHPDHDWVCALDLSTDGMTLASGMLSHKIELWNLETMQMMRTLSGHGGEVWTVAFSPDGLNLISGSQDCTLRLWDPCRHANDRLSINATINSYSLLGQPLPSPSGDLIALQNDQENIEIVNAATLQTMTIFTNAGMPILFNRDETELVTSDEKLSVFKRWNLKASSQVSTINAEDSPHDWFNCTISPDGTLIGKVSADGCIEVLEAKSGKILHAFKSKHSLITIDISPDSKMIAIGGNDRQLNGVSEVWDLMSEKQLAVFGGHKRPVPTVAFSPTTNYLVTGSWDGSIKVWNLSTLNEVGTLFGHKSGVLRCVFSNDGKTLASSSDDRTIKLWNVLTLRETATLDAGQAIHLLKFAPSGNYLLSGELSELQLWRTASTQLVN